MAPYGQGTSHQEVICRCYSCQNLPSGHGRLHRGLMDRPISPVAPCQAIQGRRSITANPFPPNLGLSVQQAFVRAQQNLQLKTRGDFAWLETLSLHLFDKALLPWMLFEDLDEAIFCRVLTGNVSLKFAKLPYGCWSRTSRAGLNYLRITIELSTSVIDQQCSRQEIVATLLHQMVHAYYLQCCGYRESGVKGTGHDLSHGIEFKKLQDLIQNLLGRPGDRRRDFPSLWGSVLYNGIRKARQVSGQSNCYEKEHCVHKVDAEQWGLDARAAVQSSKSPSNTTQTSSNGNFRNEDRKTRPMDEWLHLKGPPGTVAVICHRSRYRYPPDAFIELHFNKRVYPINRQFLETFKNSELFENRIVSIPESCGDTFNHLHSFLTKKNYPPSLGALHLAQPETLDKLTGPPCILSRDELWPAYLVTDIMVYRMAKEIGFAELCEHVLERLNKQTYTRDNPLEVLEVVYHKLDAKHRDKDLRNWIKAWLMTATPASLGDYAKQFPTNLAIIQKHEDWKDKYVKFREKGTELITDIDAVEKELAKKKGEQQGPKEKTQQQLQLSPPSMSLLPPIYLPHGLRYELVINPPATISQQSRQHLPIHRRYQAQW